MNQDTAAQIKAIEAKWHAIVAKMEDEHRLPTAEENGELAALKLQLDALKSSR